MFCLNKMQKNLFLFLQAWNTITLSCQKAPACVLTRRSIKDHISTVLTSLHLYNLEYNLKFFFLNLQTPSYLTELLLSYHPKRKVKWEPELSFTKLWGMESSLFFFSKVGLHFLQSSQLGMASLPKSYPTLPIIPFCHAIIST